jgi:hypothetical protein
MATDQIKQLEINIDTLSEVILKLNEPTNSLKIDWSTTFLTPRQVAKKIMIFGAPIINDGTNQTIPTDEKAIHMVVYGKYLLDGKGKLVDNEIKFPDCVNKDRGMSLSHPMFTEKIKNMIKELKTSIRILNIKKIALKEAFELAGKQIVAGVAAAVSALTLLPFGAGLPTAIPALQSIVTAINTLMSTILEILPVLGPLVNIPLVIAEGALNGIFALVNGTLVILIGILDLIAGLKKTIGPIVKLIP